MKKFLLGLIAVAGLASLAFAETPSIGLNTDAGRNSTYLSVYNSDNVDHEAGSVLVYKDGTYDGVEVSSTTSAANPLVAGAVPYGETLLATSWGRVQVTGYHPAVLIAVANSAGDSLVTSTTGEKATTLTLAIATTTVSAQQAVFGTAFEATTSSTNVKCIIKCR